MWIWFIIVGVLGGLLGGMGMGGGTILIPLLTSFLSVNQQIAQGINLIAFLPMAVVSIIIHFRKGNIIVNELLYVIIPGIVFAIIFAVLASLIKSNVLGIIFGVFLIIVGLYQFYIFFRDIKKK